MNTLRQLIACREKIQLGDALIYYPQVLPEVENTAKQKWITAPIIQKMDPRHLAKVNEVLYNLLL